jgi:hypothetical protein
LIAALTANGELQDDRSLVGRSQGVLVEQHGARRCLLGAHGLVHGGHAEDELRRDEEAIWQLLASGRDVTQAPR